MIFTRFIYNLAIGAYGLGIRLAALFSAKARQWITGRGRFGQTRTLGPAAGGPPVDGRKAVDLDTLRLAGRV